MSHHWSQTFTAYFCTPCIWFSNCSFLTKLQGLAFQSKVLSMGLHAGPQCMTLHLHSLECLACDKSPPQFPLPSASGSAHRDPSCLLEALPSPACALTLLWTPACSHIWSQPSHPLSSWSPSDLSSKRGSYCWMWALYLQLNFQGLEIPETWQASLTLHVAYQHVPPPVTLSKGQQHHNPGADDGTSPSLSPTAHLVLIHLLLPSLPLLRLPLHLCHLHLPSTLTLLSSLHLESGSGHALGGPTLLPPPSPVSLCALASATRKHLQPKSLWLWHTLDMQLLCLRWQMTMLFSFSGRKTETAL